MIKAIIFDWGRTLYDSEQGKIFPETMQVIDELSKKYQLALVSLATQGNIEERHLLLKQERLESYFVSILFAQTGKDHLYVLTLTTLGLQSEEVVIVDDRIKRGKRNGATTIWVRRGKFMNELPGDETEKPTYTITTLQDMYHIL